MSDAILASFETDPAGAFDFFAPYFADAALQRNGGTAIPLALLEMFAPGVLTAEGPRWMEPRAPMWLRDDGRWISICVRLRRHRRLGEAARAVLRHANAEQVALAIAHALRAEAEHPPASRSVRDGTLLDRYRTGEHAAVWAELRRFDVVSGPFRDEALEVARQTMRRVLHNVELLSSRLAAEGWIALGGALRTPCAAPDFDAMKEVEGITSAPLPPALRAFWEIVGGVDLIWDYRQEREAPTFGLETSLTELDPLSVDPARNAAHSFEAWASFRAGLHPEVAGPYRLDLAPDFLHKADISGGPPYGVELPFHGADPIFANEEHELTFVDYLRLCFRWGGFPRLERHAENPEVRRFLQRMTEGLQAF